LGAHADYENTCNEPQGARDLGRGGQAPPDDSAKQEAETGKDKVNEEFWGSVARAVDPVLPNYRGVDAHKAEKGADVENFCS
jgi:hypothetical protein